jgi:DNA-binding MarR family transcriptional regulator
VDRNPERNEVAGRVLATMPDWGHAIAQLNALIAARMGVTASDLDALDALAKHGPDTAASLAKRVDLTSGSMSRMIDRLVDAGCVRRTPDAVDRRRVLLEPTEEGLARVRSYWAGLGSYTLTYLEAFTTDELEVIQRFVDKARDSTVSELNRIRTTTADASYST